MDITKKHTNFRLGNIYYCHSTTNYDNTISARVRTVTQIHNEHEIFLLIKGSVHYMIEDETYIVNEGEVVLVPANTLHYTLVDRNIEYERIALEFPPEILPPLSTLNFSSVFSNAKLHRYTIPSDKAAESGLAKQILDFKKYTCAKNVYKELTIVQKICNIVKTLHSISTTLVSSIPDANPKTLSVSQRCIDFIKNNMDKPITAQMIADATFLSVSHILHQFKQEVGITLHHYISLHKVRVAEELLAKGITPAKVARQLGYDYYSTFYSNFVKYIGHPPIHTTENSAQQQTSRIVAMSFCEPRS